MLRTRQRFLLNLLIRKTSRNWYTKVPEKAEVRFSNIKRGTYNTLTSEHVEFFTSLLGPDRVLTNLSDVESYNTDFAQQVKGKSEVVLRPKTTEEVSTLVRFCNENSLAVCPQGGNTGLVAGSVPVFDEIIISTALMNKILHLDEFAGILTCQSGCILEVLDNYLQERGLMMPLDLGAKGLCQIGGNVSTNAGGIRLLRYGNLHGSILGLEVVLANGEILDLLSTVKKDNTGYHLKNLFIGAEGTLGVITKAVIQCPPKPKAISVAFLGINKFEDVLAMYREARSYLGEILSACELMDEMSFSGSIDVYQKKSPFPEQFKFYLLLETRSGGKDGEDLKKLNKFVEQMIEKELVGNAFLSDEPTKVKEIWEIREKVSTALLRYGHVYKYDVSLPLKNFYEFVEIMRERLKGTPAKIVAGYGHLGDGNLHLNICSDVFERKVKEKIEPFVFETTKRFGGSISAEHGIGLEKPRYLHFSKSTASIELMKEIKTLFDPKGILNPYKVLPP